MANNRRNQNLIMALTGAAAAAAAYALVIRPWMLSWGATLDETDSLLPGDELLLEPKINATHAITIRAPAKMVWPWLVQLGQGRGGFYSYDWIENMMRLDIHTSDRILPEYQTLKVGEKIPFAPNDFGVPVVILEPERALVLHADTRQEGPDSTIKMRPGDYLAVSWGFYLLNREDGSTRMVTRMKVDWNPNPANNLLYRLFLEPGSFLMERKMLLTIKNKAEARDWSASTEANL